MIDMCLETLDKHPKRATKPIRCYKVIIRVTEHSFKTPYNDMYCEIGKEYEAIGDKDILIEDDKILIGKGYIHALLNIEDAKLLLHHIDSGFNTLYRKHGVKPILSEWSIPQGTIYWKNDEGEICADRMKFDSVIE